MYINLPRKEIKKLQRLLNASIRFIFNLRKSDEISITEYSKKCHILPVHLRIQFKICTLVFKSLNGNAPDYLCNLLEKKRTLDKLRISNDTTLLQESIEKINYRSRKFSTAAPKIWNQLPKVIRESPSLGSFKTRLKTHY